jgi:hypothetical protein
MLITKGDGDVHTLTCQCQCQGDAVQYSGLVALGLEYGVSRGNGEYDWLMIKFVMPKMSPPLLLALPNYCNLGCTFFFYSSNILQELGSQGYSGSNAGVCRIFAPDSP